MRTIALAAALLALATAARAQEQRILDARLPRDTEHRLLDLAHDPATRWLQGGGEIAASEVVHGAVIATDGSLSIAGQVEGDVAVLGGELRLELGGRIAGDVTLVDARLEGDALAGIGGSLVAYDEGARETDRERRRDGDRERGRRDGDRDFVDDDGRWGRADLRPYFGGYDRAQGLAFGVGPVITTAGRNPLRLRSAAFLRTEAGSVGLDDVGYDVVLEQFLGGVRTLRVGAGVHSTIVPIETGGVGDIESAAATLLAHRDYRDYFERQGWRAFAAWEPRSAPLRAMLTYGDEDENAVPAGDPWSLRRNDEAWRLQPLIAEGSLRSLSAELALDTRHGLDRDSDAPLDRMLDTWHPLSDIDSGWYARISVSRGLDGELTVPTWSPSCPPQLDPTCDPTADLGPPVGARSFDTGFTSGVLDLRRYAPVGWSSVLALRGMIAGTPGSTPLPPQMQHALGGLGTLPGYSLFEADCGARSGVAYAPPTNADGSSEARYFYPAYGCDRVALFQAEYRGAVHLDILDWFDHWGDHWVDDDWRSSATHDPRHNDWSDWDGVDIGWSVFFDAAQGWALDPAGGSALSSGAIYDAGLGVLLGDFGVYWAAPLHGGSGSRFFIRFGQRF